MTVATAPEHSVRIGPIPFSSPMIRATLEGRKTQTRRVCKLALKSSRQDGAFTWWRFTDQPGVESSQGVILSRCPYGGVGDFLYVREAWHFCGTDMNRHGRTHSVQDGVIEYKDGVKRTINRPWEDIEKWMSRADRWRPSIHMPRWASRITLEITDVCVERLNDISEAGARSEGVVPDRDLDVAPGVSDGFEHRMAFARLWDSLNAPRGYTWESNPWVWCLSFKVVPHEIRPSDGGVR